MIQHPIALFRFVWSHPEAPRVGAAEVSLQSKLRTWQLLVHNASCSQLHEHRDGYAHLSASRSSTARGGSLHLDTPDALSANGGAARVVGCRRITVRYYSYQCSQSRFHILVSCKMWAMLTAKAQLVVTRTPPVSLSHPQHPAYFH